MPVHPDAAAVKQHRPVRAVCDRPVDGTADDWRQRKQHDLGTFAAHAKHPVAVLLAQVVMSALAASKIPRPSRPSMATTVKSGGGPPV